MLTDAYSVFLRLSAIILSFSRGWSSQKNQLQSPNNTDPMCYMCWNQCEIRLTVGRHVVLSEVPKFGDGSKPFCTVFWRDEHAEHPFTSYFVGFAIGSHDGMGTRSHQDVWCSLCLDILPRSTIDIPQPAPSWADGWGWRPESNREMAEPSQFGGYPGLVRSNMAHLCPRCTDFKSLLVSMIGFETNSGAHHLPSTSNYIHNYI